MKKTLLFSAGLFFAFILDAQTNVFHLPVQIIDGTQGVGRVLTSDSTGLGSWQPAYNWLMTGNYLGATGTIGSLNNNALNVVTDSITRVVFEPNDTILFSGISIFDTLLVPAGYIQADSIRARIIHVGDSSMTIGTTGTGNPVMGSQTFDYISSDRDLLSFMGGTSPPNLTGTINVGIGNTDPLSMLQIGTDFNHLIECSEPNGPLKGFRTWMQTGTLCNHWLDDGNDGELMYVGLKPESATSNQDAVISWSDYTGNPNYLRFINVPPLLVF